MNPLRYKDYLATIELDPDAGLFHGEVMNTRAVLTFQGRSIDELTTAFSETIADYEDWCRERGKRARAALFRFLYTPHASRPSPSRCRGCGWEEP